MASACARSSLSLRNARSENSPGLAMRRMADLPWIAESIQLRNIYTDPLNVLQAELLHRSRQAEEEGKDPDPRVEQALMVTIAGVAAGMRNTG